MPHKSKYSTTEYVVLGGGLYLGGLLAYTAYQSYKPPLNDFHQKVENRTEPPPAIRVPAQGNGLYGYFNSWFYQDRPNNHALEL